MPAAPLSVYLRDRVGPGRPHPFGGLSLQPLSRVDQNMQSICLSVSERVAPSAVAASGSNTLTHIREIELL